MIKAYHDKLASISVVGQEHAALSRLKMKEKLNDAQSHAAGAGSVKKVEKWTRAEKRNAAKLRARDIVSPITASLDYVLGSGRRDRKTPIHFGDSGVLPTVIYLGTAVATVGMSFVGGVGGYVLGLAAAKPGKGAVAGATVASGATSVVLGTAAWRLSQAAAPSRRGAQDGCQWHRPWRGQMFAAQERRQQ